MSRTLYTDATKSAVKAALAAGESPAELARRHDLPKQTVSRWKREVEDETGPVDERRRERITAPSQTSPHTAQLR